MAANLTANLAADAAANMAAHMATNLAINVAANLVGFFRVVGASCSTPNVSARAAPEYPSKVNMRITCSTFWKVMAHLHIDSIQDGCDK